MPRAVLPKPDEAVEWTDQGGHCGVALVPRILIADDHPLFRQAMRLAVEALPTAEPCEVLEAGSFPEARRLVETEPDLDLLLLDLKMPGMSGFAGLLELRRRFPALAVVIVSAAEEPSTVREAVACGVAGYIPKSLEREVMTEALGQVLEGEVWLPPALATQAPSGSGPPAGRLSSLTPQQLAVLKLMVAGKPNKIIAYELDIAETTVKAHITVILRKLGVHSRTQAVLAARDLLGGDG